MPHFGESQALLHGMHPDGIAQAITPTGSPFTFRAPKNGRVIVTVGTVTTIEVGRHGVFTVAGLLAGIVPVSKHDQVRVTYLLAPTMTFLAN